MSDASATHRQRDLRADRIVTHAEVERGDGEPTLKRRAHNDSSIWERHPHKMALGKFIRAAREVGADLRTGHMYHDSVSLLYP